MKNLFLICGLLMLVTTTNAQTTFTPVCYGTNDTARFQALATRIGASNLGKIRVPYKPAASRCAFNTWTVPPNITLDLTEGSVKVNNGQTLTVGPIEAPDKQVFFNVLAGQGTVRVNDPSQGVNVKWTGAKGDGSYLTGSGTDDGPAILAAINAAINSNGSRRIFFPAGVFRIATAITKTFANTNNVVFEGVGGSGSIILIDSGGATANAFDLDAAYSIIFRDLTFAGNFAGGSDARVAIKIANTLSALVENCWFYGMNATEGVVRAINSSLTVRDSHFRGSSGASGSDDGVVNCELFIRCTVQNSDFIDYGVLNGNYKSKTGGPTTAWISAVRPAGVIEGATPPSNAYAQSPVIIDNCIFDEGANFAAFITSNLPVGDPWVSRVIITNNNSNASAYGGGFFVQNTRRLNFENNYVGYVSGVDVSGLTMDTVETAYVKNNFFEPRAALINVLCDAGAPTSLTLTDNRYANLSTACTIPMLSVAQGGKQGNRTLGAGTYAYADLTPIGNFSQGISVQSFLNFNLTAVVYEDLTVSVTGAAVSDPVSVGPPAGSIVDVDYSAFVSSPGVVTVRAKRLAGTPDPPSGLFTVTVTKP